MFAGVDYARIASQAASEADVIVWDGGNNDFPFLRPDLHIVVVDALRPDDARGYHPGEAVLRTADVIVVNKVDAASSAQVERAIASARAVNARARLVQAASPVRLDDPAAVRGRRVLVVEDGPTITHGQMPHGAGFVAATAIGAIVVDPKSAAAPALKDVFSRYPHIGPVLPAVGYSREQLDALQTTIANVDADVVVAATPVDLARLVTIDKPVVRARYEFAETASPGLGGCVDDWLARLPVRSR